MRVIAGSARSMPLKTLPGNDIRPTTDKTKETLFNILQPYIYGSVFLDLFAGSGSIGIEALSRGASFSYFNDISKKAVAVIKENLAFTKLGDKAHIDCLDALSCLRKLEEKTKLDIIFLDPPFAKGLEEPVLEYLSDSSLVDDETMIILEVPNYVELDYVEKTSLRVIRYKKYKNNAHVFIKKVSEE